jgi:hypothetical protein
MDLLDGPHVTYHVFGQWPEGHEALEAAGPRESEEEAQEAAAMMLAGGATDVTVERWTLRLVDEREEVPLRRAGPPREV